MGALLIGCARCSTDQQDLTAQHDGPIGLGVRGVVAESDLILMRTREGMRSPRPRPAYGASSRSSTRARRHISSP